MNGKLHKAKKAKNDEFYTQLQDIENELKHYKNHFKDKVVYCNCDIDSNFWKYFKSNFNELGLKFLISTGINYSNEPGYEKGVYNSYDGTQTIRKGINGDFRSKESIEILQQADIVVTNPPFSLFREYMHQLIEYNKKFLIVGNLNAITYKETFKLIHENKLWLGVGTPVVFDTPSGIKRVQCRWLTNMSHGKRNEFLVLTQKFEGIK